MNPLTGIHALAKLIIAHASGEEEERTAFADCFADEIPLPCEGIVIGEPVTVTQFLNDRRGITARCRREDGREYIVPATEIAMAEDAPGARLLAAHRLWLGLPPLQPRDPPKRPIKPARSQAPSLDLGQTVEVAILSVNTKAARCRLVESGAGITLRIPIRGDIVPGVIARIRPRKQWTYSGISYLSGEVESTYIDARKLGLTPLALHPQGTWDPTEHDWGEPEDVLRSWAKPMIAWGPRAQYEMEQILPGDDPDNIDSDPIIESVDLKEMGDYQGAEAILQELCLADLRCLDAHAHLGNLSIDQWPKWAIRHYEVGVRIGELSLGENFDGLLPWAMIDNRPFHRCLHGYGLCLEKLGRRKEAEEVFRRLLWLNPADNLGVRALVDPPGG